VKLSGVSLPIVTAADWISHGNSMLVLKSGLVADDVYGRFIDYSSLLFAIIVAMQLHLVNQGLVEFLVVDNYRCICHTRIIMK